MNITFIFQMWINFIYLHRRVIAILVNVHISKHCMTSRLPTHYSLNRCTDSKV